VRGGGDGGSEEFEFTVECTTATGTVAGYPRSAQIGADASATFDDLPVGSTCEFEETAMGGADSVTFSPSSTVHITNDSPLAIDVTATNYFDVLLTNPTESIVPIRPADPTEPAIDPTEPASTVVASGASSNGLAKTGADVALFAGVAIAIVALGVGLVLGSRRRQGERRRVTDARL
jgi:Domain of unknown function (DUF5979)